MFVLQIIGGFPFTTDIVLITGTDLESSREEERVIMLTGFTKLLYSLQNLACIFVCIYEKGEKSRSLHCCRSWSLLWKPASHVDGHCWGCL